MADNYILTPEGKQQLEEELHYLETEKRAEVGERIKVAREFGDISENSEYDDAKNEQGMLEARIAEITRILGEATVVATPKRSNSVHIGSTVTVDMGGRERVFTIVGAAEADSHAGKISNESPVGAALLAHKKGDEIETTGPTGRVIKMKTSISSTSKFASPACPQASGTARRCGCLHRVACAFGFTDKATGLCPHASAEPGVPQPLSLTQPNPCT